MALFISHDETVRLLAMPDAIDAAEAALISQAHGSGSAPPRQRMAVPGGVHRSMSGVYPEAEVFGTKAGLQKFAFAPGGVKAPVQALFSSQTGDLLAIFWSDLITQIRTGAMGGVSIRHLAGDQTGHIGVVGSGRQARTQLMAALVERPDVPVRVYSRDSARRVAFARRMSEELGVQVDPVDTATAAVRGAGIVLVATNASTPVIDGADLTEGAHVVSIRSSYSHDIGLGTERREIDDTTVSRASVVAVDSVEQATAQDSPEIMPAIHRTVELGAIAAGKAPGRSSQADITLFKSFGSGLVDVAVANLVYRSAIDAGLGIELPPPRAEG